MRRVLRAAALTAALLSLAAACGLDDTEIIEGFGSAPDASPDGTVVDASKDSTVDGNTPTDATISDTGTDADAGPISDAGSDAGDASDASDADAEVDAGFDAGPCPTLTICDGNPSACTVTQVCAPDVPVGWTLLGYDDSAHVPTAAPCGTDYAAAGTLQLQDGGATANCECDCDAGASPSCSNTQVVITTGSLCDQSPNVVPVTSTCAPLGSPYPAGDFVKPELQADPTTCTPNLIATQAPWSAGSARKCDFTSGATNLCAAHSTCVAASGATHSVCVKQAYAGVIPPDCASACPGSYQASCWAVSNSVNDGRMCNGCGCGWSDPGCTSGVITGYDTVDCSDPGTAMTTGSCQTDDALTSARAIGVTGTDSSPTCGITNPTTPSGQVTFGTEEVVCCAN